MRVLKLLFKMLKAILSKTYSISMFSEPKTIRCGLRGSRNIQGFPLIYEQSYFSLNIIKQVRLYFC